MPKKELRKALQLKPGMYLANVMMGQIFIVQKQPATALSFLRSAEKVIPESAEVHGLLSNVYGQLGQKGEAERERTLAQPKQ